MRICKYYGLAADQLEMLFHSLTILSFLFGIHVWGGAYKLKVSYTNCPFIQMCFDYGYVLRQIFIEDLIRNRNYHLWKKTGEDPSPALCDLLPAKQKL